MPLLYSIDIIQELFYFVTSYKMKDTASLNLFWLCNWVGNLSSHAYPQSHRLEWITWDYAEKSYLTSINRSGMRWLVVDIYRTTKERGEYLSLDTDLRWTVVFIYTKTVRKCSTKKQFYLIYSSNDYNIFEGKSRAGCLEFEWPIRACLQRYLLF